MPRGPATFRGPGRAHSQHCQLYFGSVTALYMRARDRSAQGPGFSLGGPACECCVTRKPRVDVTL